jgi:large subunit ribosomal protein L3
MILGKKKGMTQMFGKDGEVIPVTAIEAGPCYVLQVKTVENDGYNAIQIGFQERRKTNKCQAGHLKKSGVKSARYTREIRLDKVDEFKPGQEIKVDIFKPGESLNVSGISKGKGFAGTVKRWHASRGPMAHGSKSHRQPGSSSSGTTPGRVRKGTRRAGRMGGERVTEGVKVVAIKPEINILLVKGAVPGPKEGMVIIQRG